MELSSTVVPPVARPVVYDYTSPAAFLRDMLRFYKARGSFSLRQRARMPGACSQTLVSQILKGTRQLNRENLVAIAQMFRLHELEVKHIDQQLRLQLQPVDVPNSKTEIQRRRSPQNHLLADWLHPYVKDLIHLGGFSKEPQRLFAMLKGVASPLRIQRSVEFLLREGFWRFDQKGRVVINDDLVITSSGIPNDKIRAFHKRALAIAMRGVDLYSVDRRKASTVLVSVDSENLTELKDLIDSFQHQLLDFIQRNPQGKDALMQVAIHLTPIGESCEK